MTEETLLRVAKGPGAGGWTPWEVTLLRAAGELYRDSFVSDETWAALAVRYDTRQLLDVIFTGSEYVFLGMLANSLGVQADASTGDRIPRDVPRSIGPARPTPVRLTRARVEPLPREEWSDEVRAILDPGNTGRAVIGLYMTLARHPTFYRPRALQSEYIRTGATLAPRAREILILRIGWLCGSEYEWAQHVRGGRAAGLTDEEIRAIAIGPDAGGWDPFEALLLRATDELHAHDTITEPTWQALRAHLDEGQMVDVVITVAGYRMVSLARNTLGVQLEPDREGFPDVSR